MVKYKVSAVSYLNTVPFIHGLKQSKLIHSIDLQLDYPSICADKLINGTVDLALVPVAVIPKLRKFAYYFGLLYRSGWCCGYGLFIFGCSY